MAGLPEAANLELRRICGFARTGKGGYDTTDPKHYAMLLLTAVADAKVFRECYATRVQQNNVLQHEVSGRHGSKVGGHVHFMLRLVRARGDSPTTRSTRTPYIAHAAHHSAHHAAHIMPHPPQIRGFFAIPIVDENGSANEACISNIQEMRQHRTRLRDIADEHLIAGLCHINQFKDKILSTFEAYDPAWTGDSNCAYAKCLKHLATVRSTELAGILNSQEKKRRNVNRGGKDVNVKVPRHDAPAPPLAYTETTPSENESVSSSHTMEASVTEMDLETNDSEANESESESYPRLTSYYLHARTSSGVGVVSTLTPMVLYITVPEAMKDSTIAVYSVVNSVPETYIRLSPRITRTSSTQLKIALNLTELSVRTKAMYKIDVHIQGISQSTEWFRTITKLDKIRYAHLHGALALASMSEATSSAE